MAKVWWDEEEKARLVEQLVPAVQNNPGTPLPTLVNRLMQQWPQDRRRKITANVQLDWAIPMIQAKLEEQREGYRIYLQTSQVAPEPPPTPEEILARMSLFDVSVHFFGRFVENQEAILQAVQTNQDLLYRILNGNSLSPQQRAALNAPFTPRGEKQTVVIIGLLVKQQPEFQKKYGEKLKLTCLDGYEFGKDLPEADQYFLMTKFCRHAWQYKVKDRSKLRLIGGGLTMLDTALDLYIKGQKGA